MSSDRFHLVAQDINEPLDEALGRFDQIYNLACPASPVHYQYDRVKTAMTCSIGTLNLLKRAAADGARFFQASTSEIYGDPEIHPQVESYRGNVNTVGPRACYDEGKRFAETLVTDFGQQHGLTTRIVRIFNTYGPRMHPDDGRVVSNFIVQALAGRDITIYGTGEQTRSFCFVDDLIEGFIRLMETDEEIDGPVNIGNPNEITVNDLARRVQARGWSIPRCRSTIRAAASRTSPGLWPICAGRLWCRWRKGWSRPSPTSPASWRASVWPRAARAHPETTAG